jgi:hypothetical protein
MASVSTPNADELTTAIRSLVDRALESSVREQVAARGKEMAAALADTATTVAGRTSEAATDAWRETGPRRADAARAADRMRHDAVKWGQATWGSQLRPAIRRAWRKRAMALGAAGGAVPISKELLDEARIRLGIQQRRREERRWRTFFLGVVLGAIAGALVAILTAPRPGSETRDRIASRAREAAEGAGEWAPLFQRPMDDAPSAAEAAGATGNGVEASEGEPESGSSEPAPREDPAAS